MLTFVANARDGGAAAGNGCAVCCCQRASARPGETNKWAINYHDWVAPIGGYGIVGVPTFRAEIITPAPTPSPANLPPTNTDYAPYTAYDTLYNGTVATNAVDPESQPLAYAHLPLYGPSSGTLVFNPNGTYTYKPNAGFVGYDVFWFTTSDQVNAPAINKVVIRTNPPSPAPALPVPVNIPAIHVDPASVSVRGSLVQFPVIAAPSLKPGDLWRLTVIARAMDCDGNTFSTLDCFDILIGKC